VKGTDTSIVDDQRATQNRRRLWDSLFALGLMLAAFMIYQPAWRGGFVWDDDAILVDNPVLRAGGLDRVWRPGFHLNYWPITYAVFGLEFRMWGLNPLGFHLVNIGLHTVSALLVWRVLVQLRLPGGKLAAAIFLVHPVNVESVAWIAQLKTVLSLMLGLLAFLLYLRHEERGGWWRYGAALALFAASALAKGTVLTLPVALLACAWWQRGRIGRRDWWRVLPFLLVAIAMAGIEVWAQRLVGAAADVHTGNLLRRTAVAGAAVWFYLWKFIWPLNLCLIYPRWRIVEDGRDVVGYLPGVLLVAVLVVAWWCRRTSAGRAALALIVAYVALLLPGLGFVKIYFMRFAAVADHYQYAAIVVPCAVAAGGWVAIGRRWGGFSRRVSQIGCVLGWGLVAVLAVLGWRQSRIFASAEALYRTMIQRNPECWIAYNNLGQVLSGRGETPQAIRQYQKAIELNPDYAEPHYNLGNIWFMRGQLEDAIRQYAMAVEIDPDYVAAHNNLGLALSGQGRADDAIVQYRKAVQINPDYAAGHYNLALALAEHGDLDEAMGHLQRALELQPNMAVAHNGLGSILARQNRLDEAIWHFQQALQIDPTYSEARDNLASVRALPRRR
jgi:Flp pilus assembly protein TadD